jgi:hypothetical protein
MRRDGVWNKAERRPARRKNLETDPLGLEALQLIEIPQNHQRFVWKSLEGNTLFLERLGKKLGGRLDSAAFITATPPMDSSRESPLRIPVIPVRPASASETRIFGV